MGREDYARAYRAGKKDYQARMLRGEKPTLAVLDDIMPEKGHYHEVPLGTIQVPIERIVGTKTVGRSNSFAGNFMPILRDSSEPPNGRTSANTRRTRASRMPSRSMNT